METIAFVLKIVVSILLSMVALASLLRGIYLWIQLWRAQGESYSQVAFKVARLNFAAGALISVTVFLWNPAILVLLVFLGFSLIGALTMYQAVAGPYQAANWLRKIEHSRKPQSSKKIDEGSQ
jgi:uncharacterized membrane protein